MELIVIASLYITFLIGGPAIFYKCTGKSNKFLFASAKICAMAMVCFLILSGHSSSFTLLPVLIIWLFSAALILRGAIQKESMDLIFGLGLLVALFGLATLPYLIPFPENGIIRSIYVFIFNPFALAYETPVIIFLAIMQAIWILLRADSRQKAWALALPVFTALAIWAVQPWNIE